MAVLGGLAVAGRLRRAMRMIEVLAMRLRIVDLAFGIASPRSDVAGRPGRLVQDRAVGSRERVPALAQYRRRNPLPLPQAHPPPWPNCVNERGSGYRWARRQQSGNADRPPDGLLDRPGKGRVEGIDDVRNRRSGRGLLPNHPLLRDDLALGYLDQLERERDRHARRTVRRIVDGGKVAQLGLEDEIRSQPGIVAADRGDRAALLESVNERALHDDRRAVGPFRVSEIIERHRGAAP